MSSDLTEDDISAVMALITRYQRLYMDNAKDAQLKIELDARIAEQEMRFQQLHAAFVIFGFDTKSKDKSGFVAIRDVVGQERYNEALKKGGWTPPPPPPRPPAPPALPKTSEGEEGAAADVDEGASQSEVEAHSNEETPASPTVRDAVLGLLKAAQDKGCKAAEIRPQIEFSRSTKLHDKTVGMTLYRLQKEGLARRVGRTWFFVPPTAETKNPGSSVPGSIEARSDGKEIET